MQPQQTFPTLQQNMPMNQNFPPQMMMNMNNMNNMNNNMGINMNNMGMNNMGINMGINNNMNILGMNQNSAGFVPQALPNQFAGFQQNTPSTTTTSSSISSTTTSAMSNATSSSSTPMSSTASPSSEWNALLSGLEGDEEAILAALKKQLQVAVERNKQLELQLEEEKRVLSRLESELENSEFQNEDEGDDSIENAIHSRSPPTLPLLSMPANKTFKFRAFKVHLYVSAAWRRQSGLTVEDIYHHCCKAKCCAEGTVLALDCTQCSAPSLVTVAVANPQTFAPELIGDDVERFTFDSCRSNCSSSRDHLKTKLVLVVDTIPGVLPLSTTPFVMQAREKTKKTKNEPESLEETPSLSPPTPCPVQTALQSEDAFRATSERAEELGANSSIIEPKVTVHIISTTLNHDQVSQLCNHYHQTVLTQISGLLSFDVKILTGLTILFTLFSNEDSAGKATTLTRDYISNTNGLANLFGADLSENKSFAILGVFTSWNC